MILDTLENARRYEALHPRFAAAFDFLRRSDVRSLEQGRHPIDGDDLFVIASKANGRTRAEAKLECHRKYIDIQYVIEGTDEMGWRAAHACRQPTTEYSNDKDIQFFADESVAWVTAAAGSFCIFFPEDAHAPLVSAGQIHKLVIKVAV